MTTPRVSASRVLNKAMTKVAVPAVSSDFLRASSTFVFSRSAASRYSLAFLTQEEASFCR